MADTLGELTRAGVAIWLDDLSRARLVEGSLSQLIHDSHVVGVTTNPTIFAKAISGSDHYNAQISELAARGGGVEKALRMITIRDVTWACDLLHPVYDRSGAVDGRIKHGTVAVTGRAIAVADGRAALRAAVPGIVGGRRRVRRGRHPRVGCSGTGRCGRTLVGSRWR